MTEAIQEIPKESLEGELLEVEKGKEIEKNLKLYNPSKKEFTTPTDILNSEGIEGFEAQNTFDQCYWSQCFHQMCIDSGYKEI